MTIERRAADAALRLGDLAAFAAAAPTALALTRLVPGAAPLPADAVAVYGAPFVISVLLWLGGAWLYQVYDGRFRSPWSEIGRVTQALALVSTLAAAGSFLTKQQLLSRAAVVAYWVVAWALLVGIRISTRAALRAMGRRSGRRTRYYAVVGAGAHARSLVEVIREEEWGLQLAGFILEDGTEAAGTEPVLGTVSRMAQVLEEHVLDEVVFAVARDRLPAMQEAILTCEELGVGVRISLDVMKFGRARLSVGDVAGVPMLALRRTPSDALALAVKRLFDVVVSATVLVAAAPLLALIGAAIALDSPGPVLFRQRRVGLNGRTFEILKFRSMHVDAEARLEALRARNEMSGPVFKLRDDPRVTRVGRILRRTSLDEFPQFWNVLLGDMSVVGPRPPLPSEVRQYQRWQRRRLSVKPGITCIWQVSGRNQIDFDRWMELDLQYIDRWSLWGDLRIFLRTIPAVLGARGAR